MANELTKEELIDRLLNQHAKTMIDLVYRGHYTDTLAWLRQLCGYESLEFDPLLDLAQSNGLLTSQEEEEYYQ